MRFKLLLFFILIFFESYILSKVLDFDSLIYDSLNSRLNYQQLNEYLKSKEKWEFLNYFIVPFILIVKIYIISIVLYLGCFFLNIHISFKKLRCAVLNAEFVFLLIPVFKLIWFIAFQTSYTIEDIQYFFPFSALTITDYKGLEPWLIYPLQTVNLFELAYVIYLSYQLGHLTKTNPDTGLKIVASSYIPALCLWVTTVMFLTLNFS